MLQILCQTTKHKIQFNTIFTCNILMYSYLYKIKNAKKINTSKKTGCF
jgi:hypothetical protein